MVHDRVVFPSGQAYSSLDLGWVTCQWGYQLKLGDNVMGMDTERGILPGGLRHGNGRGIYRDTTRV